MSKIPYFSMFFRKINVLFRPQFQKSQSPQGLGGHLKKKGFFKALHP